MLQTVSKYYSLSPKAERIIFNICLVITFLAIAALGLVLAWSLQPSKILTIYNEPIPVIQDGAKAGETVIFTIDYCKNEDVSGTVQWEIVSNASMTLLPTYVDNTPKSCNKKLLDPVIVPTQLKPGTYFIIWQVTYPVNPLKVDYTEFRSRDFVIH